MKRKIVMHGDSTLTISLPSKWAKNSNLKKGEFLNLKISEHGLLLSPEKSLSEKMEINLSNDKEWYIHRILRQLYTSGYDEIKINYSKKEQLALIRKSIKNFTGLEMLESDFNYCILKCITSLEDDEYHSLIKKLMWLINSQFNYFIEDCKHKKLDMIDEVNEIYIVVIKLVDLCKRLINKKILYGQTTSKYVFDFLTSLMNISRVIVYSYAKANRDKRLELTNKELDFILKIHEFYSDLLLAYQNLNLNKTKDFLYERERISDESLEILNDKNPIIIHFFLDIMKELSSISDLIMVLKTNSEDLKKDLDN